MKPKVLIVGTGGGNDIFSCLGAARALEPPGSWQVDFAGVLSPFHHHANVESTPYPGVTRTLPTSKRSVRTKRHEFPISFVDATVARLIEERDIFGVKNVYGLSLKHGSEGLAESLQALARKYDAIILADIGGDIFYGGREDRHVLSPMFDAMVLRGFVDAKVPGFLFEAGPGTDGELDPFRLQLALTCPGIARTPWREADLDWWDKLFETYIKPVRPGRTVPITIEAARSKAPLIKLPYRGRAHFGKHRWYANFDHVISTELCRSYYTLVPDQIENPFAVTCSDPFEWFVKTQCGQQPTNNEANLEYLEHEGGLGQFLTPSPLFTPSIREEILRTIIKAHIEEPEVDKFWMHRIDWERYGMPWRHRFKVRNFYNGLLELTS